MGPSQNYEIAIKGINANLTNEIIKSLTDLTDNQIDELRNKLKNNILN